MPETHEAECKAWQCTVCKRMIYVKDIRNDDKYPCSGNPNWRCFGGVVDPIEKYSALLSEHIALQDELAATNLSNSLVIADLKDRNAELVRLLVECREALWSGHSTLKDRITSAVAKEQ